MFTNDIEQLKQKGFSIAKTSDVQTVVTHDKPFIVEGTASNEIEAPFNEEAGKYMVTFSGYPVESTLQHGVKHPEHSLFREIHEAANKPVEIVEETIESLVHFDAVKFADIEAGQEFRKVEEISGKVYTKVDETSCRVAADSIAGKLDLVVESDAVVFVEQVGDYSALSADQKQNIVDHAPKGLSPNEFSVHVAQEIEDIAGLELFSDDELHDLIGELYSLYTR